MPVLLGLGAQVAIGAFSSVSACNSVTVGVPARFLRLGPQHANDNHVCLFLHRFLLGNLDMPWWSQTPRFDAIVLGEHFGWTLGAGAQLFLFACIWWVLGHWRAREPARRPLRLTTILRGNWPFFWVAVALAVLSWISLLIAGHAQSITWPLACGRQGGQLWPGARRRLDRRLSRKRAEGIFWKILSRL